MGCDCSKETDRNDDPHMARNHNNQNNNNNRSASRDATPGSRTPPPPPPRVAPRLMLLDENDEDDVVRRDDDQQAHADALLAQLLFQEELDALEWGQPHPFGGGAFGGGHGRLVVAPLNHQQPQRASSPSQISVSGLSAKDVQGVGNTFFFTPAKLRSSTSNSLRSSVQTSRALGVSSVGLVGRGRSSSLPHECDGLASNEGTTNNQPPSAFAGALTPETQADSALSPDPYASADPEDSRHVVTASAVGQLIGDDDNNKQEKPIDRSIDEDEECTLCLGDITEGEELRQLPCGHVYHKLCVDSWLVRQRTCPMCCVDVTDVKRSAAVNASFSSNVFVRSASGTPPPLPPVGDGTSLLLVGGDREPSDEPNRKPTDLPVAPPLQGISTAAAQASSDDSPSDGPRSAPSQKTLDFDEPPEGERTPVPHTVDHNDESAKSIPVDETPMVSRRRASENSSSNGEASAVAVVASPVSVRPQDHNSRYSAEGADDENNDDNENQQTLKVPPPTTTNQSAVAFPLSGSDDASPRSNGDESPSASPMQVAESATAERLTVGENEDHDRDTGEDDALPLEAVVANNKA